MTEQIKDGGPAIVSAAQEFAAMRERSRHTKDGLVADKMRYRRALLLACNGDAEKAMELVARADAMLKAREA